MRLLKGVAHHVPGRPPFSCKSLLVPGERNGSAEIFAQLLKIGYLPLFPNPKITAIVHTTPTKAQPTPSAWHHED